MLAGKQNTMINVTIRIVARLTWLNLAQGLTDAEVAERSGIHQNRISEWRRIKKYRKPISARDLRRLYEAGLIDMRTILRPIEMTDEEVEYISDILSGDNPGE